MSKRFVGIDLGTSNSAIATYKDGDIRVWKDPEQRDVTASAIWFDRRGKKQIGNQAYHAAQTDPEYVVRHFKRFIGSDTKLTVKGLDEEWTPEQCSAELLKTLYSYIPSEVQTECAGVVVTVPAAFDQSQKNATLAAAESAGIGQVTLLQEPVAAVMAATRTRKEAGHIVVYDLGGGTLDVAVAEWTKKGITLHEHGGVAMLGGRDIDRLIRKTIVEPWLESKFSMPADWRADSAWENALRLCDYAAELTKIRLSSVDATTIDMDMYKWDSGVQDAAGEPMYLDIPLTRKQLDEAIDDLVARSIDAVNEVLQAGGFDAGAMDELVFIGGPTHYEPLRRKVSETLGIRGAAETDPMTAVAVGAAIFAESVDWATGSRDQSKKRQQRAESGDARYSMHYDKRVSTEEATLRIAPESGCDGATLEVVSEQSGWRSGEFRIDGKATIPLRVPQMGENTYEAIVKQGGRRTATASAVKITRSMSSVTAVPLTESIGIGVLAGKRSGRTKMIWLARRGDELPVTGSVNLEANEALEAGEERSINLKVYTGENDKPKENQEQGILLIKGTDLNEGRIEEGAALNVGYKILEGGQLILTVQVPDVRQEFRSDHNYYAHNAGALDYRKTAGAIKDEAEALCAKVGEAHNCVDDKRLRRAQVLLDEVEDLSHGETDPETVKEHYERTREAKNLLAQTRKAHRTTLLKLDVAKTQEHWNDKAAAWAEDGVKARVNKMFEAAANAAASGDDECEDLLDGIRKETWETLWKEDWYVVELFKAARHWLMRQESGGEAASLIDQGDALLERGDTERLREVTLNMWRLVQVDRPYLRLEDINVRSA